MRFSNIPKKNLKYGDYFPKKITTFFSDFRGLLCDKIFPIILFK